ncbi:COMM domain [Mactra antiquata]
MAAPVDDLVLLKKVDAKLCGNLLHGLVDGICHRGRLSYDQYSEKISLQEWWSLSDAYTNLFKDAVKNSWTKDMIMKEADCLDDEYKSTVVDVISSRSPDIRSQLLNDSHAISLAHMTDFDWKLKLVMSSDKISSVKESVLAVNMTVQSNDGRKNVTVELNKEQLDNLITSLEAANKALVQFKS